MPYCRSQSVSVAVSRTPNYSDRDTSSEKSDGTAERPEFSNRPQPAEPVVAANRPRILSKPGSKREQRGRLLNSGRSAMEAWRMDDGRYLLYWRDQLVGVVTDVGWTDFPWAGGKIAVGQLSGEVRAVLEYIDRESKTDNGVQEWPFPDELAEYWRVVKPDGAEVEIMPPVIDFADSYVTWR